MQIIASWPSKMPLRDVGQWAERVERLGFDVMHVPETVHDPFLVAALAASATTRLKLRTSMVVAFPRSPMLTAVSTYDVIALSGGRFELGLASQVRGNIVGRYSTSWSDPVAQLGDYVRALRAIFTAFQTGGKLDYVGTHYRFDRLQPYFNPGPIEYGPPMIWTGGVNPRMCALGGEISDGFVCHPTNSHPRLIRSQIHPALAEGAATAKRSDGGPAIVAGPQPLMAATEDALAETRDARRSELAFLYSTPAYRRQLEAFGLEHLGLALSDMARQSNWDDLSVHMSDDVMRTLIPQGTYADMPDILSAWYAGLCSGIVLTVPDGTDHDDEIGAMVARCKSIPSAP